MSLAGKDKDKLILAYPAVKTGTGYSAPTIQLEFGARATGEPHHVQPVACDIAPEIEGVTFPVAQPLVMAAERTFWEKATAAHVYCLQGRLRGERYSRHWYDLAAIAKTPHFAAKPMCHQHGETMRTNYILVDYENVQPKDIGLLQDGPFKVKVFLGPTQAKIPVSLATSLQALGTNGEYIQLEAAGSNALDFHIAYYIGVLTTEDPTGFFHIISKDTGFDPLIKHLKARRILAQRSLSIAEIPYFKATVAVDGNKNAWVDAAVADLVRCKASKPSTQKTLLSTLDALFRKELSPQQLSELLDDLRVRGLVRFNGARITYSLPSA